MQPSPPPFSSKPVPTAEIATGSTAARPASQALAEVVELGAFGKVTLPARFARAAVEHFLRNQLLLVGCAVQEHPSDPQSRLPASSSSVRMWAIGVPRGSCARILVPLETATKADSDIYRYPEFQVLVTNRYVPWLLRSLEAVKPDELDSEGRPLPWVEGLSATQKLGIEPGVDAEEIVVVATDPGPTPPLATARLAATPIEDREIHAHFERFLAVAGLGRVPLTLIRSTVDKCGFTSGRMWQAQDSKPLRVRITTCPNSDLAEILSTLLHELAHALSRSSEHGVDFKQRLIEFAERCFPSDRFAGARQHLAESYHIVDAWVTAGIRQALVLKEPPLPQTGDELAMADIAAKVRKARALGADRCGTWEGIRATAVANQLITVYGMNDYRVRIDAHLLDLMVDRWLVLEKRDMWRRSLAHRIARTFDVYSLASSPRGKSARMHCFGRHADVVQYEYLFALTQERIDTACELHIQTLRRTGGSLTPGVLKSERTSFCDSAVLAFCRRLNKLAEADASAPASPAKGQSAIDRAHDFALAEHGKRGMSWGSGRSRTIRNNAAGQQLGESLEFTRGVAGQEQKRLARPASEG